MYAPVKDGKIFVSDVDRNLSMDIDAPDGVVDIATALKAKSIKNAYVDVDPSDAGVPWPGKHGEPVTVDTWFFHPLLGLPFADYAVDSASEAFSNREKFSHVHMGGGYITATDGARLIRYGVEMPAELDVMIPVTVMDVLKKLGDWEITAASVDDAYLRVSGKDFEFAAKIKKLGKDEKFADVDKLLAGYTFNVEAEITPEEIGQFRAGLAALKPFLTKTSLVRLDGERAIVANNEINKYVAAPVPQIVGEMAGYNAANLDLLLKTFETANVKIYSCMVTDEMRTAREAKLKAAQDIVDAARAEHNAKREAYEELSRAQRDFVDKEIHIGEYNELLKDLRFAMDEDNKTFKKLTDVESDYLKIERATYFVQPLYWTSGSMIGLLMPVRVMAELPEGEPKILKVQVKTTTLAVKKRTVNKSPNTARDVINDTVEELIKIAGESHVKHCLLDLLITFQEHPPIKMA
jgi:hypothetical protein